MRDGTVGRLTPIEGIWMLSGAFVPENWTACGFFSKVSGWEEYLRYIKYPKRTKKEIPRIINAFEMKFFIVLFKAYEKLILCFFEAKVQIM